MQNKFLRTISRVQVAAPLLAFGAAILLMRVVIMLTQGALDILVDWVGILLIVEGVIDIACLIAALRWWTTRRRGDLLLPLRLGAAAAILHAIRVLIFVLGRIPPL